MFATITLEDPPPVVQRQDVDGVVAISGSFFCLASGADLFSSNNTVGSWRLSSALWHKVMVPEGATLIVSPKGAASYVVLSGQLNVVTGAQQQVGVSTVTDNMASEQLAAEFYWRTGYPGPEWPMPMLYAAPTLAANAGISIGHVPSQRQYDQLEIGGPTQTLADIKATAINAMTQTSVVNFTTLDLGVNTGSKMGYATGLLSYAGAGDKTRAIQIGLGVINPALIALGGITLGGMQWACLTPPIPSAQLVQQPLMFEMAAKMPNAPVNFNWYFVLGYTTAFGVDANVLVNGFAGITPPTGIAFTRKWSAQYVYGSRQ